MNPKKYIKSPFVLAVMDYFKANPDEELLNDDVEAKFGKPLKRSIYEELRPAVKDGLLKTRKEGFSLVYSLGDSKPATLATDDADTRTLPLPLPERDPQGLSQHAPGATLELMLRRPAGHTSIITPTVRERMESAQ